MVADALVMKDRWVVAIALAVGLVLEVGIGYALLAGLDLGRPGGVYGPALAIGRPSESTVQGYHHYNFTVESAGGGITWSQLGLTLSGTDGAAATPSGPGWNVTVYGVTEHPVAYYDIGSTSPVWTVGGTAFVTSQQSILVASPPSEPLNGDLLTVAWVSAAGGAVSVAIP